MIIMIMIMMLTSPEEARLCCRQYGNKEKECLMMTLWRFGGSHFETLSAKVCVRICRTSSGTLQSMDQLFFASIKIKRKRRQDHLSHPGSRPILDWPGNTGNKFLGWLCPPLVVPGWHPRAVEYGSSEKIYKTIARNLSCTHTVLISFVQVLSYMKVYFLSILIHQHALLV